MENLLFLGVPILKHIRVTWSKRSWLLQVLVWYTFKKIFYQHYGFGSHFAHNGESHILPVEGQVVVSR